MQLINAPGKLLLPFANAGAKNSIPVASQIGIVAGAASLTDGFPPLTRTPIAAGGVPPSGLDMNGILYALSAAIRWANAGGGYVYDGTFTADANITGYPKGARILRSDGAGYWLNTIDGNTVDPESVTVNAAQVAGWVPDLTNGVAAVTMTSANVTLTPLQYGKPIIVLSGVLTANLNLIFPNLSGEWTVVNNCTGAFTVTAKTAAGTGAVVTPGRARIIWGDGTNIAGAMNEVETPPQFDNATKIATTAFVKQALGAVSGFNPITASATLTLAQLGSLIVFNGSTAGQTLTLPALASVPNGYGYYIQNIATVPVTIKGNAAEAIVYSGLGVGAYSGNTLTLGVGDSTFITSDGSGWYEQQGVRSQSLSSFACSAQTWQDVSGSRAVGTVYTNSTGRPIAVTISLNAAGATGFYTVSVGGSVVNSQNITANFTANFFAIVPAGATYTLSKGGGDTTTGLNWKELR